jgi:hypothetical protein
MELRIDYCMEKTDGVHVRRAEQSHIVLSVFRMCKISSVGTDNGFLLNTYLLNIRPVLSPVTFV